MKTDGNRIVAVAQARVHLVAVNSGKMTLRKTLPDTMVRNVFLSGERLLVFSGQQAQNSEPGLRWAGQRAVLTMYDISNLGDPALIATLTIDGDVLDARLVGTQVRVATVSSPDVDAPSPVYTPNGDISKKSKDQLRAAVAHTDVDDWIPRYTLRDGAGGRVSKGRLVDCADLARPKTFSGSGHGGGVLVRHHLGSAVPQDSGRDCRRPADLCDRHARPMSRRLTGAATGRRPRRVCTSSSPGASGASTYQGSGEVPGSLLNQYAMSEYDGVLRVASTVSERRGWVNSRQVTEGIVTTLHEQNGALANWGRWAGSAGRTTSRSERCDSSTTADMS